MPTPADPAPCAEDEQLYECPACGKRLCSAEKITTCPSCREMMQNISMPRPE